MRGRGRSVGVVTDIVHSSSTSVSTPDLYSEIHKLRVLWNRGDSAEEVSAVSNSCVAKTARISPSRLLTLPRV